MSRSIRRSIIALTALIVLQLAWAAAFAGHRRRGRRAAVRPDHGHAPERPRPRRAHASAGGGDQSAPVRRRVRRAHGRHFRGRRARCGRLRAGRCPLFRALKVPIYFLPGNHDIPAADAEQGAAAYRSRVGPARPAGRNQRRRARVRVYRAAGARVHDRRLRPGGRDRSGARGLDRQARPLLPPPAGDRGLLQWRRAPGLGSCRQRPTRADPAAATPVKAVVTGHFHRDELQWMGDIPVFTSPSVAGYWGRQASFRIYEYRDGHLGYRSVYLQD